MEAIKTITATAKTLTDAQIIEALAADYDSTDAVERLVRTSLREVLEGRHDVAAEMDAWAEDLDTDFSHDEALIQAVTK